MATIAGPNDEFWTTIPPIPIEVSGFYGPGAWAAWFITLFASWIPLIQDDYTHNLHFISYALYTNWAAMDALRQLSKRLGLATGYDGYRALLTSREATAFEWLAGRPMSEMAVWVLVTRQASTDEQRADYLAAARSYREWEASSSGFTAARAVLSLGLLLAVAQLLVCWWKVKKHAGSQVEDSIRRRGFVILVGMFAPSLIAPIELMLPEKPEVIFGVSLLFLSRLKSFSNSTLVLYIPNPFPRFSGSITFAYVLVLIGSAIIVFSELLLLLHGEVNRACYLMPCTSVSIRELDQSFALFAALFFLVYEYGPQSSKFMLQKISLLKPQLQGRARRGTARGD
ncbi:hypothetical protein CC86DRAFT_410323 [Ophiobolus disseminans]|uniref:Uncharacterized protein n=1 Tax=Ophiobolus disseminans TaxID=1469910 RepID=A0A6A6ZMC0_9PLEO|nr:hypothetical protein CC86DRAFT_410323 [Ophiobolus disseminans]